MSNEKLNRKLFSRTVAEVERMCCRHIHVVDTTPARVVKRLPRERTVEEAFTDVVVLELEGPAGCGGRSARARLESSVQDRDSESERQNSSR